MRPSVILAALAFAAIAATASFDGALTRPAQAQSADAGAEARTAQIVAHAKGFLSSLTDAQRKSAMFAFNDGAQRVRWSNFPQGIFQRVGLRYGDMTPDQRARLNSLLEAVL